jgi:reactive intermediate/imine deaminase
MNTKFGLILAVASGLLPRLAAADATSSFLIGDPSPARAQLPFSDAVHAGNTLYVTGTLGIDLAAADPKTATVPADPAAEARKMLDNFKHAIEAAGFTMDELVLVQVYCTDLDLYGTFNEVYRTYFHQHFPARAFIGASKLVRGAHFEIMGTAVKGVH